MADKFTDSGVTGQIYINKYKPAKAIAPTAYSKLFFIKKETR